MTTQSIQQGCATELTHTKGNEGLSDCEDTAGTRIKGGHGLGCAARWIRAGHGPFEAPC